MDAAQTTHKALESFNGKDLQCSMESSNGVKRTPSDKSNIQIVESISYSITSPLSLKYRYVLDRMR